MNSLSFSETKYVIVKAEILPDVYKRVLRAKKMLFEGEAKSASEAAKLAEVSRSAYYKYKDAVFESGEAIGESSVTIEAKLTDTAGVLSDVMNEISNSGANVLSINQTAPVNNVATVSITVRISQMVITTDELIKRIKSTDGVKTVWLS